MANSKGKLLMTLLISRANPSSMLQGHTTTFYGLCVARNMYGVCIFVQEGWNESWAQAAAQGPVQGWSCSSPRGIQPQVWQHDWGCAHGLKRNGILLRFSLCCRLCFHLDSRRIIRMGSTQTRTFKVVQLCASCNVPKRTQSLSIFRCSPEWVPQSAELLPSNRLAHGLSPVWATDFHWSLIYFPPVVCNTTSNGKHGLINRQISSWFK